MINFAAKLRHLLRTVCDAFVQVSDGRATPFDGDLEDYRRWLTQRDAAREKETRNGGEHSAEGQWLKASETLETAERES